MQKLFLLLSGFIFFSCNADKAPADQDIQQAVKDMYELRNRADGGGGWKVEDVTVIRKSPGSDKQHYSIEVSVKGIHKAPPLADPGPDEPIDETRKLSLVFSDGKWVAVEE